MEIDEKERNKNYRSIPFRSYPMCNGKFLKKKAKKYKKLKKIPLLPHFKPKQVGRGLERGKIKIIVTFRFCLMCNRKFQKNNKKFKKLKKYQCGFIISQNRFEKAGKERK